MKLLFIIENLGPYHIARLKAISLHADLLVIEVNEESIVYHWDSAVSVPFSRVVLPKGSKRQSHSVICATLDAAAPDVVFTSGWSSSADVSALLWAGRHRVPVIVMSDSKADDTRRIAPVEWVKRRMLAHASGAFVAGQIHADYVCSLGIPIEMVRTGYDVVDNEHFTVKPDGSRRGFIASARFISKKNLPFLLRAYAAYRVLHLSAAPQKEVWDLTLLGDGPSRSALEDLARRSGGGVEFRGFVQYPALPAAYAQAGAFLHASTTEQWGLVVNEAMAAGLPVLVSTRCGCAPDLVYEGVNGYSLHPEDEAGWAGRMLEIALMQPADRSAMGQASQRIVARLDPKSHADVTIAIAREALVRETVAMRTFDGLLLAGVGYVRWNRCKK